MTIADERALIERAQTGAAGFGELFDAYYDRIYAYAYRRVGSCEQAEDIAASVFEDALRGIKRVRWQGKPIAAWLYRIAARRVADFYRARKDDAPFDSAETHLTESDPAVTLQQAEEFAMVRRGLEKLAGRDREILRLAYFDEVSGQELAALLDCSVNSAYVRLHRALMKLRRVLADGA